MTDFDKMKRERDEALERVRTLEERIRSAARLKRPVSVEAFMGEQLLRERAERERDAAQARVAELEALLHTVMLNHRTPCQCGQGGMCHVCQARAALIPQVPPAQNGGG